MHFRIKRFFHILLIIACLIVLSLLAFYGRYELIANHLKKDLGYRGATANAIKHAYAAADLYDVLNAVSTQSFAENAVLMFGSANEQIERITKYKKPDQLREVMKDFYNNLAGITFAQWRLQQREQVSTFDYLRKMADREILIVSRDSNAFYADEDLEGISPVDKANKWLYTNKKAIQGHVKTRLDQVSTTSNP